MADIANKYAENVSGKFYVVHFYFKHSASLLFTLLRGSSFVFTLL